ncbi:response regulator receiver domain, partial [Nocardioides kongjuensis]
MREMATRFERHVQKQVLEFLQTVLMIDDEAYRRSSPLSPVDEPDDWSSGSASGDLGAPLELRPPPAEPSPDDLDVQEVSISFGSKGLACAILSPQTTEENDEFKPAFVKTARRADALILDWNMNGDNGKTAEKLVRAVLKEDVKSPRRRLRLITVYTGEPDLQQIAERLSVATGETLKGVDISWDDEAKVAFSRGPVRVSVFAKKHVQSLAPALEGRRKSIAELPTLVVEDFSRHSTGLVTSASLSALAGIRNDAHRVLAALGPELDPAILGQRISLPHPEDVERQVEGLIVSEIQAVIQDHEVGSHVGLPRIKEWLAHHKTLPARGISSFTEITAALRLKLLSEGFSDEFFEDLKNAGSSKTRGEKMQKDSGTLLFSTTSEERALSDRLLASRMSLRSRYAKPTPVLQLGSILERGGAYA